MEVISVIRDICNNDLHDLINLLQQGYLISTEDAKKEFTATNKKAIIYEDKSIQGFALVNFEDEETRTCRLKIYVGKAYRHQGIGKKLHDEAFTYAKNFLKAKTIATGFAVGKDDSTPFFRNLCYEKWFVYHTMKYFGKPQPEVDLSFINYEDKYFEKYEILEGEAFYNLRKANDIRPYNCSDFSDKMRQCLNKNKDYIYINLDDKDQIISTIMIKNGILDNIMVGKKYEGQGYGGKTTQFGINKAILNGFTNIELSAVDWNKRAIHIYEGLGFKVIQTFHNYRQQVR